MKQVLQLVALSGVLAAVEAKVLKWHRDEPSWSPAKETAVAMYVDNGWSPAPTSAPHVDAELVKRVRGDNTCGYISGLSTESLYCDVDDYCAVNTFYSVVGCCASSISADCTVATTCLPSSLSPASFNPFTFWCGSSAYPACVTYVYAGTDEYSGYTLFNCGPSASRVTVYDNPISNPTSTIVSTSPQTTRASSLGVSSTSTQGPQSATASPPSSPAPVGAIVGGVVGGIAVIALIGVGIFFLVRHNKNKGNPPAQGYNPNAPAPTVQQGPPGGGTYPAQQAPHMQQNLPPQGYPPSFVAPLIDNRSSMAKSPYDVSQSSYEPSLASPPGSPPPVSPYTALGPTSQTTTPPAMNPMQYSPPPASQAQFGVPPVGHDGYQIPPQQQPSVYGAPQGHTGVSELPTLRGDGQLRELA